MRREVNDCRRGGLRRSGVCRVAGVIAWMLAQIVVLFLAAGRLDVLRLWLFVGTLCGCFVVGGAFVLRTSPEIINQRGERKRGTKWWDRLFVAAYVPLIFVLPIVAGFDVGRYHWSSMGALSAVAGTLLHILAAALFGWAMMANPHFETTVRIQSERGHKVVTTGPYRMVRHPGYVGGILLSGSVPLIVGSVWALVPALVIAMLYIVRTALEDVTLQRELPSYPEYATRVKYRLLPLIW